MATLTFYGSMECFTEIHSHFYTNKWHSLDTRGHRSIVWAVNTLFVWIQILCFVRVYLLLFVSLSLPPFGFYLIRHPIRPHSLLNEQNLISTKTIYHQTLSSSPKNWVSWKTQVRLSSTRKIRYQPHELREIDVPMQLFHVYWDFCCCHSSSINVSQFLSSNAMGQTSNGYVSLSMYSYISHEYCCHDAYGTQTTNRPTCIKSNEK